MYKTLYTFASIMKKSFLSLVVLLFLHNLFAQKVEFEKTFDISKKAAKGILSDFTKDNDKLALKYITGAKYRSYKDEAQIKSELYLFDKDYNFISQEKDVDKYKFKKVPKKKGENYSEECIEPDITGIYGVLTVRKVRYDYKWRKAWGEYEVTYTNIEKVKPRDSKDRKLIYLMHTNNEKGDLIALTTPKLGPGSTYCKDFLLLTVKNGTDISITSETTITFEHPHTVLAFCYMDNQKGLKNENDEPLKDVVAILQPFKGKKVQQNKYVYLRFDAQGKVLAQQTFEAPACWDFYFYPDNIKNQLLLIGRANKNPTTPIVAQGSIGFEQPYDRKIVFNNAIGGVIGAKQIPIYLVNQTYATNKRDAFGYINAPIIRAFKATDIFVAYFKDDILASTQTYDLKTLNAQIKVSSKEKKPKAIPLNVYDNYSHYKSFDNDIFIGSRITSKKGYKGYNLLHFTKEGKLKNIYQIKPEKDNKSYAGVGTKMLNIGASSNGFTVVLGECQGVDMYKELGQYYNRYLYRTRISKINTDGSINPFVTVGKDEKDNTKYFIDEDIPILEDESTYMVLFGRDKGDDTLWFCKITY